MLRPRIFPTLLLRGQGLVKGVKFKNYQYVGDPINAVKIFNDKEVDELLFLDITATNERRKIDIELVRKIADECFMPFAVGGGISSTEEIRDILSAGAEKVSINTAAVNEPSFISKSAQIFGNQSIVVTVDYKKTLFGKTRVFTNSGKRKTRLDPVEWAVEAARLGAGEIMINSIERDGTMTGYDVEMIKKVTEAVSVPVIASGGAWTLEHIREAIHKGGASAATAGSMFVFHGRRRAVLISFPSKEEKESIFKP